MANEEQRTGTFGAGDVTIFYRAFGRPGRTPILIIHGSNYYDSYDWIDVASALAGDREVVVPDKRGWGKSTWSPKQKLFPRRLPRRHAGGDRRDEMGKADHHGAFGVRGRSSSRSP